MNAKAMWPHTSPNVLFSIVTLMLHRSRRASAARVHVPYWSFAAQILPC